MWARATQVRLVSLRELLPDAEFVGADDIRVSHCCADPLACRPGDLFALMPDCADGPDAVQRAARQGATTVLADRPTSVQSLKACYVCDVRQAYGRLCQALADNPSHAVKTVAITGSHGKTTTSVLTASVLNAAGHQTGLLCGLGYCDGVDTAPAAGTTPPADELAGWLSRMRSRGCTRAVVEVSNRALEQSRAAGVEFDVAAVTNVRTGRLPERHGPNRLLAQLRPEGVAIVNADEGTADSILDWFEGPAISIGLARPAELTATVIEQSFAGQTFLLSAGSETVPVRTPLVGACNLYNCLTAAAVGIVYGLELTLVARGLEAVERIPGRLERVECGQPFSVFVDAARTKAALARALDVLRDSVSGRLICVVGADDESDRWDPRLLDGTRDFPADLVVTTGANTDGTPRAGRELRGGLGGTEVHEISGYARAVRWALTQAKPGDCVLIVPGGESESSDHPTCWETDAGQFVRQCLYKIAAADQLRPARA